MSSISSTVSIRSCAQISGNSVARMTLMVPPVGHDRHFGGRVRQCWPGERPPGTPAGLRPRSFVTRPGPSGPGHSILEGLYRGAGADQVAVAVGLVDAAHRGPVLSPVVAVQRVGGLLPGVR